MRDFDRADAILAADIPSIPLYDRPWPLVRASSLVGVRKTAEQIFTWNMGLALVEVTFHEPLRTSVL